jgi:DNA-binding LacI/PurR family transcriptional regulator
MEVRIPQDMAVVGFDDDTVAPLLTPPLTTVRQQRHEMGARAVSMLLDVLNGKPVEQQVFLPVELVVRQSCGADLS